MGIQFCKIVKLDIEKYAEYYKKLLEVNFDCIQKFQTEDLCNLLAVNHHYEETKLAFETSFKISTIKTTEEYISLYDQFLTQNNVIKIVVSSNHPNKNKFEYHQVREYEAKYAEIPDLISFLQANGYQIETQITNMLNQSEIKLSNKRLAFSATYYGANQPNITYMR